MVNIVIENLEQKEIIANDLLKSVLMHLQEHDIDWMQDCGGKGRCTTCKAIIVSGMENLSRLTLAELKYRRAGALAQNERLCCQVRVSADIRIRVADEYKLPHLKYSR